MQDGILESANASCRANKFTRIIQGNQEWQIVSQKLKLIHHASIHPVHFGKFSHPRITPIVEKNILCVDVVVCLEHDLEGIWILNPLKTGGQPMAWVFDLEVWRLVLGFDIWSMGAKP